MIHAAEILPLLADSPLDQFPWLSDLIFGLLGLGLLVLLIYLCRPGGAGLPGSPDFSINVNGEDIQFKGRFPSAMEAMVEDFLVNDCRIEGPYTVTGKWEEDRLAIAVRGDSAKLMEQRIRNFLKLNIKKP